ncbi:hypothetical protein [uncultured Tateyamaria sp.]|uniref:hypothetical protein n=1 Tax=uncultured Tateyamaria sp. TaxID=455651 RepID=UPI0026212A22|nr:hypothetical protein [uncultured Tateyamaria sp.]
MTAVFIAGSIKIKHLDPKFVERIENIVKDGLDVIVGDANGADTSIQKELLRLGADNVTVYCTGEKPRNNVGNWSVKRIRSSAEPGTRAFFTAKDIEMASQAEFGLMLWDASSTGTLSNVFELLSRSKITVVFVNREKRFLKIKEKSDLSSLLSVMTDGARKAADRKIGLNSRISALNNEQIGMAF